MKIPIYQPSLLGNEKSYVMDCLESSWISSKGEYVQKFENMFSDFVGVKHATTVSNGTVALHLALLALGVGPGDEVIVPTLTYIASVNAIKYTGAQPVFADSEKDYWQVDVKSIEKRITPKTKAIMAVHLYGHPCDMPAIMELADKFDLFVVEDCAEAIGSVIDGNHVGCYGHVSTFSFFGNKTITTGEGGMVVTNDATLIQRAVHYKSQGLAKHREYWHDTIGYNYRMTNICAAIGLAQMESIEVTLKKKKELAKMYFEGLKDLPLSLHNERDGYSHSYWMNSILVNDISLRDKLREHLSSKGIETRPLFYPVHTMPMYSERYEKHEVAEYLGWRGINLPSWPGLTIEEVNYIIDSISEFYLS